MCRLEGNTVEFCQNHLDDMRGFLWEFCSYSCERLFRYHGDGATAFRNGNKTWGGLKLIGRVSSAAVDIVVVASRHCRTVRQFCACIQGEIVQRYRR